MRWPPPALVAVLGLSVAASSCGGSDGTSTTPSVSSIPAGSVALVEHAPDGDITMADFNSSLKQTALGQGITKVPKPSDPKYATLKDAAMSDLITKRWVAGEAEERGITASGVDIQSYIKENIGDSSAFQKAAKKAGFSESEAKDQVRLIILGQELQKAVGVGTKTPKQVSQVQASITNKWTARTVCATDYAVAQCSNGPPPTNAKSTTTTSPIPGQ